MVWMIKEGVVKEKGEAQRIQAVFYRIKFFGHSLVESSASELMLLRYSAKPWVLGCVFGTSAFFPILT